MTAFEEFGVLPEIALAIEDMEWNLPTDVQAEAIPLILGGGDVLLAAETGSGKTGAFCLPILQTVWESLRDLEEVKLGKKVSNSSVSIPVWTMSYIDRGSAMSVAADGLSCQSREFKSWHGCRCTCGVRAPGKYYFEASVADEGLCRVGFSTRGANLDLGKCASGFGYGGTGKKSNSNQFNDYGESFGKNDVIGCFIDLDNWERSYAKNGINHGKAFNIPAQFHNETFYPAIVLKNAEMKLNFGKSEFKHPPKNGYLAICEAKGDSFCYNPSALNNETSYQKPKPNAPKAIIFEPSRELAEQTYNQIEKFKTHLKNPLVKQLLVMGGTKLEEQKNALQSGVHIVVGTPGRLDEMISHGFISLEQCRFFVLDEADALLEQGHLDLIVRIHNQIPKMSADGQRLQMIVCSATLHDFKVKKLANTLMHFPTWVDLKGEDSVPETVHHVVCMVDPQTDTTWKQLSQHIRTDGVHAYDRLTPQQPTPETYSEAIKILKGEYCIRAIEQHNMERAIIFCRTKIDCDNLEKYLQQRGGYKYSCVCLHGDRKPQERKNNLDTFKKGNAKFLICTDVAARGLDIIGLPYMINFTMPDDKANYLHRIGRVGRAERMGLAISLVATVPEKVWYHGDWCKTRGRNCNNTNLTESRGCCIWYNEKNLLAEIEDHLNITIQQVGPNLEVPLNEFDGKVTYGQISKNNTSNYKGHADELLPIVQKLSLLELEAQSYFLKRLKC